MKFLIVAHDIPDVKAHLMPWRTVCEVTEGLRRLGHDAVLMSLDTFSGDLTGKALPDGSIAVRKQKRWISQDVAQVISAMQPDIVFWPLSWRDPSYRTRLFGKSTVKVVGWFPGGCYQKRKTFVTLRKLGLRGSLPYIREAWAPRHRQMRHWNSNGIRHFLTMTDYTAECVIKGGASRRSVHVIPPGRDNKDQEPAVSGLDAETIAWINLRKYFLFMGPPGAIRGIFELLSAFELAAEEIPDICLVCLFRSDAVLERGLIGKRIDLMRFNDRIRVCWESLPPDMLNSYMESCHVAVMPFVVVPSEIPLAVIEAARWGKPVITTGPSGTGEYVRQFGLVPTMGDVVALANSMKQLASDVSLYNEKGAAASRVYEDHPTWTQVAQQWANVAEATLSD